MSRHLGAFTWVHSPFTIHLSPCPVPRARIASYASSEVRRASRRGESSSSEEWRRSGHPQERGAGGGRRLDPGAHRALDRFCFRQSVIEPLFAAVFATPITDITQVKILRALHGEDVERVFEILGTCPAKLLHDNVLG